jgi:hypothetical protein
MPLTATGRETLDAMIKEYGSKKGKAIFYASINEHKKGSESWHHPKK